MGLYFGQSLKNKKLRQIIVIALLKSLCLFGPSLVSPILWGSTQLVADSFFTILTNH